MLTLEKLALNQLKANIIEYAVSHTARPPTEDVVGRLVAHINNARYFWFGEAHTFCIAVIEAEIPQQFKWALMEKTLASCANSIDKEHFRLALLGDEVAKLSFAFEMASHFNIICCEYAIVRSLQKRLARQQSASSRMRPLLGKNSSTNSNMPTRPNALAIGGISSLNFGQTSLVSSSRKRMLTMPASQSRKTRKDSDSKS